MLNLPKLDYSEKIIIVIMRMSYIKFIVFVDFTENKLSKYVGLIFIEPNFLCVREFFNKIN